MTAPSGMTEITSNGVQLEISLRDPYWLRLVSPNYVYEEELADTLNRCSGLSFDFIDAGANIGFWSAAVGTQFETSRIVAIEPNPKIFRYLQRNTQRLAGQTVLLNAGLVADAGNPITLYVPKRGHFHTDGSFIRPKDSSRFERIEARTIELRDLINEHLPGTQAVLLKLDVEGIERELIEQIVRAQDARIAIVYEDHGADRQHQASKVFLRSNYYDLFFLHPGERPVSIQNLGLLDGLKTKRTKGYNLLALPRSGFWNSHRAQLLD